MRIRAILCCLPTVALTALSNGCCTWGIVGQFNATTVDTLNPSALYCSTNRGAAGLEGNSAGVHEFVLISKKNWASPPLPTNGTLALEDVKQLPPEVTKHLTIAKALPLEYAKVAELPKNDVQLVIRERHPDRANIVFLPFAMAVDVVLLPAEAVFLIALEHNGPGS